jgi:dienelactone hydrolase
MLYGSTNVSTGGHSYDGYLARPDLMGEWPTVVVVSPLFEAASSVKSICRVIARHAIAAVAPAAGGLDAYTGFITNPAGHWSNAEYGFGVLGLGDGSEPAILEATASELVVALALVDPVLDDGVVSMLAGIEIPMLGLSGRDVAAGVDAARSAAPHAEWVIYDGVGAGYWNIDGDEYVAAPAEDTGDRVVEFFSKTLPARV